MFPHREIKSRFRVSARWRGASFEALNSIISNTASNKCKRGKINSVDNKDEFLSTDEARKLLGISRMTLLRRVADGEIKPLPKPPALKRRARLQFRRADVEQLAQPEVSK